VPYRANARNFLNNFQHKVCKTCAKRGSNTCIKAVKKMVQNKIGKFFTKNLAKLQKNYDICKKIIQKKQQPCEN
jgi:hypothetical protein